MTENKARNNSKRKRPRIYLAEEERIVTLLALLSDNFDEVARIVGRSHHPVRRIARQRADDVILRRAELAANIRQDIDATMYFHCLAHRELLRLIIDAPAEDKAAIVQSLRGVFLELSDSLGKLIERRQVLQALPGEIHEVRSGREGEASFETAVEVERLMQVMEERWRKVREGKKEETEEEDPGEGILHGASSSGRG